MAKKHILTNDEILKLKAVLLYIISKCKTIDYYHIFKILYFADKDHYAKYGRRIVKDTFCALEYGPVPSNLYDAIKMATKTLKNVLPNNPLATIAKSVSIVDEIYPNYLKALENADMDELSKSDIECLDKSIEENKSASFNDLYLKSHDSAWSEAWNKKHSSPINEVSLAKAGGANEAMINYIKEELFLESQLC